MEEPLLLDSFGVPIEKKEDPSTAHAVAAWAALAILLIGTGFVGCLAGRDNGLTAGRKEVMATVSGWTGGTLTIGTSMPYGDQPKTIVTSGPKHDTLMQALDEWRHALGPLPISVPTLYEGTEYSCSSLTALACAHLSDGSITITSLLKGDSLRTVLMHEIGHLLGVPHIEGDPFMDATYSENVGKPTDFSVALAKLAIAKKKRH